MNKIDTVSTAFSVVHTKKEIEKLEDKILNILESVQTSPGPIGLQGPQGLKGDKGIKGDKGDQGIKGDKGVKGDKGDPGVRGEKGERGETGPQGERGADGQRGTQGERGEKGEKGEIGLPGLTGPKGDKGDEGKQGAQGERGERGEKGERGLQGADGATGADGARGEPGPPGPKGEKGDVGVQGPPGEKGEKGDKGDPGTPAPDYKEEFESLVKQFNTRLNENQETVTNNLQKQIERINQALSTIGGGGSVSLLHSKDVEYKSPSVVEEDSILIFDPTSRKFVVTKLSEVLERLKIGVEIQYNKLIDTEGNFIYIGEALPGTGENEAKWRIKRIEEIGDDYNILWADGTAEFEKIWDNRLSFTYS